MKTIFRNFLTTLRRFKMASTLNILGLSVAFAAFILILMQVRYEYSFDRFHKNADRIYRVEVHTSVGSVPIMSLSFGPTFGGGSVAGVEAHCMLTPIIGGVYATLERNGTKAGFMEQAFYASNGFLQVFTPELLEGTDRALAESEKVLLPASLARKFFGSEVGVLGRRISLDFWDETRDYQVGGVYRDFPDNSQIKNVIYISKSEREWQSLDWGTFNSYMYVLLHPGADVSSILAEWNRFDFASKYEWIGLTVYCDGEDIGEDNFTVTSLMDFGDGYTYSPQEFNFWFEEDGIYSAGIVYCKSLEDLRNINYSAIEPGKDFSYDTAGWDQLDVPVGLKWNADGSQSWTQEEDVFTYKVWFFDSNKEFINWYICGEGELPFTRFKSKMEA